MLLTNPYASGQSQKENEFAATSELASGLWQKIGVDTTGIYKVTYTDMAENGWSDIQIDATKIRLHGFGQGQLSEIVGQPHFDDLPEIPIQVYDKNNDGIFNGEDYLLFYAESPHSWIYSANIQQFQSNWHDYADINYYFISINKKTGKRIENSETLSGNADYTTNQHDFLMHSEENLYSLLNSGRYFVGKIFDITDSYSFNIELNNHIPNENIYLFAQMAARAASSSTFTIKSDDFQGSISVPGVPSANQDYQYANAAVSQRDFWFKNQQPTLNLTFTYQKSDASAQGWFDYFDINYRRKIKLIDGQLRFFDKKSLDKNIVKYQVENTNSNLTIWDVTQIHNPKKINYTTENNSSIFLSKGDELHTFIAFDRTAYFKPQWIEKVANQDLHNLSENTEYVIFTTSELQEEAERLADFHRNYTQLNVVVADIQKVYNEFSSGMPDIAALRNFLRMLYAKSDTPHLKYVLFFGDASFDVKNILGKNQNIIPTYESKNFVRLSFSYATDDFFTFLDEGEGNMDDDVPDKHDIASGRFSISTIEEAQQIVDKVLNYNAKRDTVMSDWRNIICFIADDEENNRFVRNAEDLSDFVKELNPNFNIEKIYLDAYPQQVYSGGQRYPDAKQAISTRVENGALFINYSGHGGETGLSAESVVEVSDIKGWTNKDKLPIFITATCEFSRFDDVERTSAGEFTLNNKNGGAIALVTTSRATSGIDNYALNHTFYFHALSPSTNKKRLGDMVMKSKQDYHNSFNTRHYILLGDPALEVAFPTLEAKITAINHEPIFSSQTADTLQALDRINMEGEVYDDNGNFLPDFNGYAYISIYDKVENVNTLGQDASSLETTFKLQKNLLFKGKSGVLNGKFNFSFIVPKDIDYKYGNGKVSLYVSNYIHDGNGRYENIIVGGYNENADVDMQHPDIELYINDTLFVDGGMTGDNPILFARLKDNSAINTAGTGIGHDIIAYIDDDSDAKVLNKYYIADIGTYKSGTVTYPFYNIPEGKHTMHIKAWDVYNNSSSASVDFEVVLKNKLKVRRLINYPNPVVSNTSFRFEHNYRNELLEVSLDVYNMLGQHVHHHSQQVNTGSSFVFEPFQWDMKSSFGTTINKGIYIYKITVKTENGLVTEESNKLLYIGN